MRLPSQAQYGCDMHTLINPPLADLKDPSTIYKLRALHRSPRGLVVPLPPSVYPRPPEIAGHKILQAVRRLNPNSAAGPDLMSPKLLHLLPNTKFSPHAVVTGLSALTNLVNRLARVSFPLRTIPLTSAATLLPLYPRPEEISPMAIGRSLRRLVTIVLLQAAIEDKREHLAP